MSSPRMRFPGYGDSWVGKSCHYQPTMPARSQDLCGFLPSQPPWVGSVLTATSRPEGGGWTACPGWSLSTRELPWRQQDSPPSRCWIRGAAPSNTGKGGGMAGTGLASLRRGECRLPPWGASGQLASGGGWRQQVGSWARQPSSAGCPVSPPAE